MIQIVKFVMKNDFGIHLNSVLTPRRISTSDVKLDWSSKRLAISGMAASSMRCNTMPAAGEGSSAPGGRVVEKR